jgi:excisionase family DNA binding protein
MARSESDTGRYGFHSSPSGETEIHVPGRDGGHRARRSPGGPARPSSAITSQHFLLTSDEVADLLRTTRAAIYAMTERGQLPGVIRVGRRLLFRRADLIEWLSQNSTPSPRSR